MNGVIRNIYINLCNKTQSRCMRCNYNNVSGFLNHVDDCLMAPYLSDLITADFVKQYVKLGKKYELYKKIT